MVIPSEAEGGYFRINDSENGAEMKQSNAEECALLSEGSLAEDWNKSEEDEAWQNFQQEYCACPIDIDQF